MPIILPNQVKKNQHSADLKFNTFPRFHKDNSFTDVGRMISDSFNISPYQNESNNLIFLITFGFHVAQEFVIDGAI